MNKLPIASKARSGARWIEADAAVIHVAGTTEAERLPVRTKAKTAERTAPLGPVEAVAIIPEMRKRVVAWIIEREAIRKRKESGQPPPWTDDPILRAGHFCNVYREHDYGSICVSAKIVQPFSDYPELWFLATVARCINEPAAWIELGTWAPFDPAHYRNVLEARQARGERVFRTQAYKPPTPPDKGDNTIRFLVDEVLGPL
jgi:hypothetical protein